MPLATAFGTLCVFTLAASPAVPGHVVWAERLVAEVAPDANVYGSHPTIVRWAEDGETARNRSVCSSFVTHLFERAYDLQAADIRRWFGRGDPHAIDYVRAIRAERGFASVGRVVDLRAGDLIAFADPPGHNPTGHVMMADGAPVERTPSPPLEPELLQYEIAVIDSSHSGHGIADTRDLAGAHATGVGRGTVRLYAAPDGTIAGYAWSTRATSTFYSVAVRPIVLGRYTGPPVMAASPEPASADRDDAATDDR